MMIVFRADASSRVGTGHVMRCLTLARALREQGARVLFVSRASEGHLCDLIKANGYDVAALPAVDQSAAASPEFWLDDCKATRAAIEALGAKPDWLIMDHYGLERRWQQGLRDCVMHIMVIDDLADRPHDCDVLLDQNFDNPRHARYDECLPAGTRRLLGTRFALVRPEFRARRAAALARRSGSLERLLISMGGADPSNDTGKVLSGLMSDSTLRMPIDVIVGQSNPHQEEIRALCAQLPDVELHVQTSRVAELMERADLSLTAGGSTTWERCVLGLPALVTVQSADQVAIAAAVADAGGHRVLGRSQELAAADYARGIRALGRDDLAQMAAACATLCDGLGAERVADQLIHWK